MSRTPVKSAPPSGGVPDQPFDPKVVARAEELAARYEVRVRQDGPSAYVGTVIEVPTVFGCGASEAAAVQKTRELLKWALAYLLENGRTPPAPQPRA
jgi:predicted RNase H-like HicB family nuclease